MEIRMRFPKQEPLIAALANDIATGLTNNPEEFPSPPVSPDELRTALTEYLAKREAAMEAAAAAEEGTAAKDEVLDNLTDLMKANLRYAENTTRCDSGKLKRIGWGGRSERTSLEVPGEPRTLEILGTGEGWVLLDWKEPSDGGRVAAYKVQRRRRSDGAWRDVGIAVESEVILSDQERGTEMDYRVLAVNKAGESTPSPSVTVLL
jgi:hypothetical protein